MDKMDVSKDLKRSEKEEEQKKGGSLDDAAPKEGWLS